MKELFMNRLDQAPARGERDPYLTQVIVLLPNKDQDLMNEEKRLIEDYYKHYKYFSYLFII